MAKSSKRTPAKKPSKRVSSVQKPASTTNVVKPVKAKVPKKNKAPKRTKKGKGKKTKKGKGRKK